MVDTRLVKKEISIAIDDEESPNTWIVVSSINDLLKKAGHHVKIEVQQQNVYFKSGKTGMLLTLKESEVV